MRIIYVFIENYKCLQRKGFKLSSKYDISCEVINGNTSHPSYSLSIKENYNHIDDFWGGSIIDVSALIGANASGKSTFLDFLRETLPKGMGNNPPTSRIGKFCFLLEIDNALFLHDPEHLIWNFPDIVPTKENNNQWFTQQRENIDFVLYSGHFDSLNSKVNWVGLHDLRTENLLRTSMENTVSKNMRDKDENKDKDTGTLLIAAFRIFEKEELTRQVKLSKSIIANKILLHPPKFLRIDILTTNQNYDIAKYYPGISNIYTKAQSLKEKFLAEVFTQGLLSFIRMKEHFVKAMEIQAQWIDFLIYIKKLDNEIAANSKSNLLNNIDKYFNQICEKSPIEGFEKQYNVWKLINDNTNDNNWYFEEAWRSVSLEFSQITTQIIDEYFDKSQICDYLYLSLSQSKSENTSFSSGELSALNLFSRLHDLKYKSEFSNNIIIAIDEAEVALHPEWQRQYFKNLLQYLKNEFNKETGYQIQLIICSHSPLILSDIPKQCINYLGNKPPDEETFASNIHSLYKHSFFLNGAFIGAFAQEKIKDLISRIEKISDDTRQDELEEIEKEITIIGEPFLKKKIFGLYASRLPEFNPKRTLQFQLEQLDKEREKIKKKIDEADNDKNK